MTVHVAVNWCKLAIPAYKGNTTKPIEGVPYDRGHCAVCEYPGVAESDGGLRYATFEGKLGVGTATKDVTVDTMS